MADASLESLVELLGNRNGTMRLLAQRQLVSMKDPESIPLLERVVMDNEDPLARAHALWTLDGMEQLDVNVLTQAFLDDEPLLRSQAMRISGRHVDNPAILDHLLLSLHDTDTTVRRHAAGALALAETSQVLAELVAALDRNPHDDVLRTLVVAGARRRGSSTPGGTGMAGTLDRYNGAAPQTPGLDYSQCHAKHLFRTTCSADGTAGIAARRAGLDDPFDG